MKEVREGMRVVDADGNELGTIEEFKMGNPEAVTAEGQAPDQNEGLFSGLIKAFTGGPDVPQERAERLLRIGYVKIDNKGAFAGDSYIAADQVDRVTDDTLWLTAGYRSATS